MRCGIEGVPAGYRSDPMLFRLPPHRRYCRTLELKPVGRATLAPAHIGYRANGPDTKAGRVPA